MIKCENCKDMLNLPCKPNVCRINRDMETGYTITILMPSCNESDVYRVLDYYQSSKVLELDIKATSLKILPPQIHQMHNIEQML